MWTEGNSRFLPDTYAEKYPQWLVSENELVVNLTAQSLKDDFLGRVCLTGSGERCLLNQRIARLSPVIVSRPFLLRLFQSKLFRDYVRSLNTGSLIQHMFTSQLAEFCFPLPPYSEQDRVVNAVDHLLAQIESWYNACALGERRLISLRESILQSVFGSPNHD